MSRREPSPDADRNAFARELVDHIEYPEPAAVLRG
jgi:hypothetical protein